jgi:hypothetical protein
VLDPFACVPVADSNPSRVEYLLAVVERATGGARATLSELGAFFVFPPCCSMGSVGRAHETRLRGPAGVAHTTHK